MRTLKMMKMLLGGMILVPAFLLPSCSDDEETVTAAFTSSETDINPGESVTFTNGSVNASYYQWDFGDGEYSFEESPTHEFSTAGTYEVSLTAIGGDNSDTATDTINVEADYEVTIYAGQGIENIDIGDTWAEIQSVYPATDTAHYILDDYLEDYGYYYHVIYYYNEGIELDFINKDTVVTETDDVYYIWVEEPYEGATEKGISIGSTMDDAEDIYGEPEDTSEGTGYYAYWYDSKGIGFYSYYGKDEVDYICIYEAYETSSMSTKSAIFESIVKKPEFHLKKRN